jgi:hypothetical protein
MRGLPIVKAISEQENMTHTLNSLTRNPESILGINRVTVYRIANEPDPRLTPRQRHRSLLRTGPPRQATPHSATYSASPGGKCLNMLFTFFPSSLMFLPEWFESVPLAAPRHTSFLLLASKMSTTRVPTL